MAERTVTEETRLPTGDPVAAIEQIVAMLLRVGVYRVEELIPALGYVLVRTMALSTPRESWGAGAEILVACVRSHMATLQRQPDLADLEPEGRA